MNTLLALAAIGPWTYAGFLDDPGPTPSPKPGPVAASKPAEVVRPKPDPIPKPEPKPEPAPTTLPVAKPAPTASAPPTPTPTAPPTVPVAYRLADAVGQTWEHPDPAHLRSFVEARNRILLSSRCADGRCR